MNTNMSPLLGAFALLLVAAPAFACEEGADSAMHSAPTHSVSMPNTTAVQSAAAMREQAPQTQLPARSTENTRAPNDTTPALMFEKPFQKWWTED